MGLAAGGAALAAVELVDLPGVLSVFAAGGLGFLLFISLTRACRTAMLSSDWQALSLALPGAMRPLVTVGGKMLGIKTWDR